MTPCFIYLFGIPTSVAIGTGLFQIIFTSGYGTLTHFLKGNIDFLLVASILAGSLAGSQVGVILCRKTKSSSTRYYFSFVVFAAIVVIVLKFLYNMGYLG